MLLLKCYFHTAEYCGIIVLLEQIFKNCLCVFSLWIIFRPQSFSESDFSFQIFYVQFLHEKKQENLLGCSLYYLLYIFIFVTYFLYFYTFTLLKKQQ